MERRDVSRRTVLQGGAALAALALLRARLPALASPLRPAGDDVAWPDRVAQGFPARVGEEVIPWLDQPGPNPVPDRVGHLLHWEDLNTWITPVDQFFTVKHYELPDIDPQAWRLEISGLVERPRAFTLDEIKARPVQEVAFTLECSGNHGFAWNFGLVGNAIWMGAPLAAVLQEAGVLAEGSEVVFWGTDTGPAEVNDLQLTEQFSRSMSLEDAMDPRNILCWGMNGEPLLPSHGFPVRLIAPGWYGVANVKWLRRIEVLDRPYEGRFMARDYVTIREAQQDGATIARFTSVGLKRLKSAPAKVTQLDGEHRIIGAAWGAQIAGVEVRIDDGDWLPATIDEGENADSAWAIWSLDWGRPAAGEHAITTRAIDTAGNVQPAMDDPLIANKLTYWESNGQITRRVLTGSRIFPETGHTLGGEFLEFWQRHGGLTTFGYPITEEFDEESLIDGQVHRVQYFERQRFELHPENAAPNNVQLGLLGLEALPGAQAHPPADPHTGPDCDYFEQTGHNACSRFREHWQQHGGLLIFGYPVTEEFQAELDGGTYTTQHFERARFEYHPENESPYEVLLGLLGIEALLERYGGNPPPNTE
jgi:DMSO/TMAO reductase YedYZ molybdopterin-dependent catalytic subunit